MAKEKYIRTITEELLESLPESKKIDIVVLARELGFVVGNTNSELKSFILVDKKDKNILNQKSDKVIGVAHDLKIEEKRYLIAYELGIYLLNKKNLFAHKTEDIKIMYENSDINYFANCLLMPEEQFTRDFKEIKKYSNNLIEILEELQKEYKVPILVILKRIEELEQIEIKSPIERTIKKK